MIHADVATYVSYISLYFLLKSGLSYVYRRPDSLSVRADGGVSRSPMLSVVLLSQVPLLSISVLLLCICFQYLLTLLSSASLLINYFLVFCLLFSSMFFAIKIALTFHGHRGLPVASHLGLLDRTQVLIIWRVYMVVWDLG